MELFKLYDVDNIKSFEKNLEECKNLASLRNIKNEKHQNLLEHIINSRSTHSIGYVELLLKYEFDPNRKTSQNYHLLSILVNRFAIFTSSDVSMLKLLLHYGANVNFSDNILRTACLCEKNPYLVETVTLLLEFGVKNNYIFKHYSIGNMSLLDTCKMSLRSDCTNYGFRYSSNLSGTQQIINLLSNYVPKNIPYEEIRKTAINYEILKRSERIAAKKQQQIYLDNLAKIEKNKIAQIEKDRITQIEKDRVAKIEKDRIAQIEKDRIAQIEKDRIIQIEKDRFAEIEKEILAKIEQKRLAKIEKEILEKIERERLNFRTNEYDEKSDKNESEASAYFVLAINNLEYLHSVNNNIPENLRVALNSMTAQLLIKAGQKMPQDSLNKLNIPPEYKYLIEHTNDIKAFWE